MKGGTDERERAVHVRRDGDRIWIAGRVVDNRPHEHHAMQVTWGHGQVARIQLDEAAVEGRCLVLDGGITHSLDLSDGLVCLIDRESQLAARLRARWLQQTPCAVVDAVWPRDGAAAERLLDELAGPADSAPLDPRVVEVLDWLDKLERDGRWADVSLEGALGRVHLSRSRFLHLFSQEVGSPWRSYLVWRRALVAMTLAARGRSLTEAAHTSGYADSAHLSRQFVALFGVTPAAFAKNSQFLQV